MDRAVIVFLMQGCPACHDYEPRFKRIASPLRGRLPMAIKDVHQAAPLADRFGIKVTPTTVVWKNGRAKKIEGAVPDTQIVSLLRQAIG